MNLRKIIDSFGKNHEMIRYIKRCIRGLFDVSLRIKILKSEGTQDAFFVEHFGNRNPEKIVGLVQVDSEYSGFFSLYEQLVWAIMNAERFTKELTFSMGKSRWYSEMEAINGTFELFEYYYEQPFHISYSDAKNSKNVIVFDNDGLLRTQYSKREYSESASDIKRIAEIQKKYIHLNEYTSELITNDIKSLLGFKKTLGVQCRGTGYKVQVNDHPVYVPPTEHIDYVKQAINKYGFEQIFLATDEDSTVKLFKNEFGEKVVCYDSFRAIGETNLAIEAHKNDREHHNYLFGLEVIRDVYTLASCQGLIAGKSGVVRNAIITKVSKGESFEYLEIIDKGLYHSNIVSTSYAEQIANEQGR